MRSWNVCVRCPINGYSDGDECVSGGSYPRWVNRYVVARTKNSAERQARKLVGWPEDTRGKIKCCKVIEVLE